MLRSTRTITRTPLSLACENAGVFGRPGPDSPHRGMEVLQCLISSKHFPKGQFSQRDSMGWQFWHYAIKVVLLS